MLDKCTHVCEGSKNLDKVNIVEQQQLQRIEMFDLRAQGIEKS